MLYCYRAARGALQSLFVDLRVSNEDRLDSSHHKSVGISFFRETIAGVKYTTHFFSQLCDSTDLAA